MKYKPKRDIPLAVRELKTLKPSAIAVWIREHRTVKDKKTGKRKQVIRTPESITMWFKDHPEIKEQIQREIIKEEVSEEAVSETLFENGTFEELDSIKEFIRSEASKGAKEKAIKGFLRSIKRVCMGKVGKNIIKDWGLKHPDRLTLSDAKEYVFQAGKVLKSTKGYRDALRLFLRSRGVRGWDEISSEDDSASYAHLYTEKIPEVIDYIYDLNEEAGKACDFAFICGTRLTAALNADTKYMRSDTITLFEKAAKHKPKTKVTKWIPPKLLEKLPKEGKLFPNLDERTLCNLLRTAYKAIIPDLADEIPMPFHFLRHQCAQWWLRWSGWNYGLVAKIGGWTVGTLERYYGKMDEQTAFDILRGKRARLDEHVIRVFKERYGIVKMREES